MHQDDLLLLDKKADEIIKKWTFGTLVGNLLPPPVDVIIVGAAFARMGQKIGEVYGVTLDRKTLKDMGEAMCKGITAVIGASCIGTELLKTIPGVNIWVALLIQPPIVAAMTHSVGNSFKQYYKIHLTEGRDLTPEQMKETAMTLLKTADLLKTY